MGFFIDLLYQFGLEILSFCYTKGMSGIFSYEIQEGVLFFARVVLGAVMIYYGWPKIKGLKKNGEDFVGMGFRPGIFWGTIVAFLEFFGGILVVLGAYSSVVALLFSFEMLLGATWKIIKAKKKFPDYSYDIVLLALALVIAGFGQGLFAIF